MADVQKTYALILGVVLGVFGVLGLFNDMVLIFGVNLIHSIAHLVAAAFGIYAGTKGTGRGFNLTIGWFGVALGVLGFVPGISDLFLNLLNINTATTILHLLIGVISLIVGVGVKP